MLSTLLSVFDMTIGPRPFFSDTDLSPEDVSTISFKSIVIPCSNQPELIDMNCIVPVPTLQKVIFFSFFTVPHANSRNGKIPLSITLVLDIDKDPLLHKKYEFLQEQVKHFQTIFHEYAAQGCNFQEEIPLTLELQILDFIECVRVELSDRYNPCDVSLPDDDTDDNNNNTGIAYVNFTTINPHTIVSALH